jgi:hypothetical protein
MAFDISGLALIGGVKGSTPQVWAYKTNDTVATVDTAGYFDNGSTTNTGARNLLAKGDLIYVWSEADTTGAYGFVVVNSNSSGIIDTSNVTAVGAIDSD